MSWLTKILHLNDEPASFSQEELEEQKHRSEIAKKQAEEFHKNVVMPVARQAERSITRNNYGEAMSKAFKPPVTGGA